MNETIYADLFEDEVAEILRYLPARSVITDSHNEFVPAATICEDGIYSSGEGMFTQYIDGKKTGTVNQSYLINYLPHKTFAVVRR